MYKSFCGLNTDLFRLSADHRFCIGHPSYIRAIGSVQYAFSRAQRFVMITGRLGTGKRKGVLRSLGQPAAAHERPDARREGLSRESMFRTVGKVLAISVDIEQKA